MTRAGGYPARSEDLASSHQRDRARRAGGGDEGENGKAGGKGDPARSCWGRLRGSSVRRLNPSRKQRRNSPMMLLTVTVRGSKMPSLSLPACILRWILPVSASLSALLMGNSC